MSVNNEFRNLGLADSKVQNLPLLPVSRELGQRITKLGLDARLVPDAQTQCGDAQFSSRA